MSLHLSSTSIILDALTPFMLANHAARGRVVRLSNTVHTILSRHAYPPAVASMLGELLVVASMLSANLKHEGILTIQLRGKGAVRLMVADAARGGELRGYAELNPEYTEHLSDHASPKTIMGEESYLAITLDPGPGAQRYQGIVALEGDNLTDALLAYFTRSQQIEVMIRLAVAKDAQGRWQAGGFMLERVAEGGGLAVNATLGEDHWVTAQMLASTLKPAELLDPLLMADALLFRLFHEDGVWAYAPHLLQVGCRCSRERILDMLSTMPLDDRAHMVVDGKIAVHCQFCNRSEIFTPEEVGIAKS